MSNRIVIITLAIFVLSGCAGDDKSLSPLPDRLVGTWEESYELEFAGLIGIPEDQDNETFTVRLVSRVVFEDRSFRLSIREDNPDAAINDRLFAGTYNTYGDTLALFVEDPRDYVISRPYLMQYSIFADSLKLGEIPIDMGNDRSAISFIGLPWRHYGFSSLPVGFKTHGTFGRSAI